MGRPVAGPGPLGRSPGQGDGLTRHGRLAVRTAPGHVFNNMPVPIAGGEILQRVHAGRVFPQRLFHNA